MSSNDGPSFDDNFEEGNRAPNPRKKKKNRLKDALLRTSEGQRRATPRLWKLWMLVIFLCAATLLAFAIVDVSVQYSKLERSRSLSLDENYDTEAEDDDDSNDVAFDTLTRHSAAYVFAGPLNLPVYMFAGVVLAYLAARSYNLRLYYANVKWRDMVPIVLTSLFALVALVWRLLYENSVRRAWDRVNHISELLNPGFDLPDGEDVEEYDIPYIVYWGSSPFSERSQYLYISLILMLVFVLFKMGSFFFLWWQGDSVFPQELDPLQLGSKRTGTWLLSLTAINLTLAAVLQALFVFVILAFQVSGTKYWLMFNSTPLLVFAFVFAGWCAYILFTGAWWTTTMRAVGITLRAPLEEDQVKKAQDRIKKNRENDKMERMEEVKRDGSLTEEQKETRLREMRQYEPSATVDEAVAAIRRPASRARLFALLTFLVTVVVGAASLVFGVVHLYSLSENCSEDPLDSSSDLKQGVCGAIDVERNEATNVAQEKNTETVFTLYVIFSIWLFVAVLLQFLLSVVVTFYVWCTPAEYSASNSGNGSKAMFSTQRFNTVPLAQRSRSRAAMQKMFASRVQRMEKAKQK